ncbi:DUF305 domain-containing protein [Chlorogloeopsis sp. ULAP02]|jgi:uncharacterized protein (DUF305 family)|uniref:DUF305 domain-containing protein n=1 Tax=Chlorogloeopsis sp. ULAP02 TaxID=3107926 RepID=UPI003134B0A7
MQLSTLKNSFLSLTLVAIASVPIGLLTACSTTTSQNQASNPTTTATDTSDKQPMNHGSSTNHNMTMDLGSADSNYNLRFIDAMIPHHQGAVKMAQEAQEKSKRPEIKKLASEIIKDQDKEIAQLKQWRTAWYPGASSTPVAYDAKTGKTVPMPDEQMQGMMMNMDLGAADTEFDLRFINAMIPHHESAITMAQDAVSKSKRPEIKKLAQSIIDSQQTEINQMKQWRKTWYNQ